MVLVLLGPSSLPSFWPLHRPHHLACLFLFCFFISVIFFSFLLFSFSSFFVFSFGYTRMYHGHDLGIISLQVMPDGILQLVSIVPMRTGAAVQVFFCCLPSRRSWFDILIFDHRPDFGEINYNSSSYNNNVRTSFIIHHYRHHHHDHQYQHHMKIIIRIIIIIIRPRLQQCAVMYIL